MDWFTLIAEIGARNRADSLGDDSDLLRSQSGDSHTEDFDVIESPLSKLEAAGAASVLNMAALQLNVLFMASVIPPTNYIMRVTRSKLIEVIQDSEYKLRQCGSYEPLYVRAKEMAAGKKEAGEVEEMLRKNEQKLKRLRLQLEGNARKKTRELNKRQETIGALKDDIQEILTKNDIKVRFIDRWETSRQEQSLMRCDNAELELKHKLEEINDNYNTELRVFEEMCAYLNVAHKKLEKEIQEWGKKYKVELETRNNKIKLIQAKRTEEQIKLQELTELYEEHQREINEYLEHKEQKRREAEHDKFIYDMVTKIQAWWRGTMVRRCLGPYKKRKKLGKDKKKKK